MIKMPPECKAYFVADVKRILPPKSEMNAKNRSMCRIIRVLAGYSIVFARPGDIDALTYPVQSKMREFAPFHNAQPTSRASQRCAVSVTPFFRSTRFGPGQIRDAAPGGHRWTAGWIHGCRLRLFTYGFFPAAQAVPCGGVVRPPAPAEGAASIPQVIGRDSHLDREHFADRARTAPARPARACARTIWRLHLPAQHRASVGQAEKKRVTCREAPRSRASTNRRSASECLFQYELLRCQALVAGDSSSPLALEVSFIERKGLAAWMAVDWSKPPVANDGICGAPATMDPSHDLVVALADLVLGNREEIKHG
jgi:hypothetical protein